MKNDKEQPSKWDKLNEDFDNALANITDEEFEAWYKKRQLKKQPDKAVESVPVKSAEEIKKSNQAHIERYTRRENYLQTEIKKIVVVVNDPKLKGFAVSAKDAIKIAHNLNESEFQLQNNNAIYVIEERIKELDADIKNNGNFPDYYKAKVNELNYILKLLKA